LTLNGLRAGGLATIAAVAVLTAAIPASADDGVDVYAGGQVDFSNYVYVGATMRLGGKGDNGLGLGLLLDTGDYDYVDAKLGTVKANYGGGELDVLYRMTRETFWSDFAVGLDDEYTGLMPYDPSNPLRGQQFESRLSTDGGAISGPWRADWEGYYGLRLQDYEALVGVTHALSPIWRLGAEVYGEGNPTYSLYEAGPYAALSFAKDSELQFSAGEAWEPGLPSRAYARAVIYQRL
jgi:hypothetical protein